MKKIKLEKLSAYHHDLWRDPSEIICQSQIDFSVSKQLLEYKVKGPFWEILHRLKIRLMISREYEHFVLTLGASSKDPEISHVPLPHPSGIAIDHERQSVFIASSRNPNQIYTFRNFNGRLQPTQTNFYPGNLYIHDLTLIKGVLYANAVGHNAVVRLEDDGTYPYAWWPLCVQKKGKLLNERNYLQLNSISGGKNLKECFFTATTDQIGTPGMGDHDFSVDGKGVVFSGKTRQPICHGLTRPHSVRLYKDKVWLNNSGYGQLGFVDKGSFKSFVKLPGWTRGLSFYKDMAFVGVSRVLPKFSHYAPGLDAKKCVCAVMLIDLKSTQILASISWPYGNQIFSVETLKDSFTSGFINV